MIADVRQTPEADVLVDGVPAASLRRTSEGVEFRYRDDYLSSGLPAVATTLPLSEKPVVTAGGAVPPFFAGLLPEGRRLSALRRSVKTSADDELSLLLAVGADPVGAVAVIPAGGPAAVPTPTVDLSDPAGADFSAALTSHGVPDPVAMAGVQDKASARTIAVPVTTAGSDAILKISPPEYPQLVENEAACFRIGSGNNLRIPYADTALLHDRHGRAGLMVRRFDRSGSRRIAVEDELHELFAIERGEKGEPSPAPSAAYAFVSLRRNDAQDPERLQIMCERRRLASIESDELHRIFPHREFSPRVSWVLRLDARQSAARKSASR